MVNKRVIQRIFLLRRFFHPKREREALPVNLIIYKTIIPFEKRQSKNI